MKMKKVANVTRNMTRNVTDKVTKKVAHSAEPTSLEPDDYFDQMMDWFEMHLLNQFLGLSGSGEYLTKPDPIGRLVVDSKTKMAKLVEGKYRLLGFLLSR